MNNPFRVSPSSGAHPKARRPPQGDQVGCRSPNRRVSLNLAPGRIEVRRSMAARIRPSSGKLSSGAINGTTAEDCDPVCVKRGGRRRTSLRWAHDRASDGPLPLYIPTALTNSGTSPPGLKKSTSLQVFGDEFERRPRRRDYPKRRLRWNRTSPRATSVEWSVVNEILFQKLCSISKVLGRDVGSLCRNLPLLYEHF